jgi:acetoin:2,6-dichlorophenolindophenol oxidoreductase subunit beta
VTVVTYSRMLNYVLAAANHAANEGADAEVIDLRTLNPLDLETITGSVTKTGRVMVVTEACLTGGPAAEISARIQEECFDFLEEPIVRIAGEDVPIPVAPALEASSVPSVDHITEVIRKLVRWKNQDSPRRHKDHKADSRNQTPKNLTQRRKGAKGRQNKPQMDADLRR